MPFNRLRGPPSRQLKTPYLRRDLKFQGSSVTLPALQNNSMNFFFLFACGLCSEEQRRSLVNFGGLRFRGNKAISPLKNWGKNQSVFGAISRMNKKNRGFFVLCLF